MRTYERGVEAETLACGTGAVATAIIASAKHGMISPIYIHTRSKVTLRVAFKKNGNNIDEVILSGPAKVTFEGIVEI
jgi:diaminopimelate epimerase